MTAPESTGPRTLPVTGAAPYDVVVGRLDDLNLSRSLGRMLVGALGHRVSRVGLVHGSDPAVTAIANRVRAAISGLDGISVLDLPVPDGEAGKRADVLAGLWERLGEAGFTRSDAIVAVGGGATTDLGGFVAATWLRGVSVIQVPTTLLAMVDAAVGGKTGINTAAGKNLVGAFHEPAGVICDLTTLDTLPRAELVAGLGEVIKCGFIADPVILDLVESTDPDALTPASPVLRELVERAIQVKIDVVIADLKETGGSNGHPGREVLNYGHTLAHAIERAEDYRIRHGEAVAIGCVYAAELAQQAGRLDAATTARHRSAFGRVGLPTHYSGAEFADLLGTMRVDKKARGATLRFLVLDGVGAPGTLVDPDPEQLQAAYRRLAAPQ